MLRGQLHHSHSKDGDIKQYDFDFDFDFSTLLQSVQTFDAERWASRVSAFGRARPETAGSVISVSSIICLVSLARCYQSAVILYLVLSTSPCLALVDPQLRQTVHIAKYTLNQHLCLLFKQGHNGADLGCDGPLHTQLWKFVAWPIFVSLYVRAGWGIADSVSEDDMKRDIEHMRSISSAMGTRKFLHVEKLAQRLQQSRAVVASKGIKTTWTWDDAFHERSVFVV